MSIIPGTATGFEAITVSTVAVGLTETKVADAKAVMITSEDGPVRYRVDGETPTSTDGHEMWTGQTFWLRDTAITLFRSIRQSSTDAKLRVTYFK